MNNAIDNSGLKDFCKSCNCDTFVPVVSYVYDVSDGEIVVQEGSTYPAGDGIDKITVTVTDIATGDMLQEQITVVGVAGAKTIDVSTLDGSAGFNITAVAVTDKRCTATLTTYDINSTVDSAGSLSHTNKS